MDDKKLSELRQLSITIMYGRPHHGFTKAWMDSITTILISVYNAGYADALKEANAKLEAMLLKDGDKLMKVCNVCHHAIGRAEDVQCGDCKCNCHYH